MTHHFKNSRASMQLRLNFSLTKGTWMTEALCRLRASSWVQTPLLELSMRRWCPSPRRWTCPMLLRQQPNGCGTWCIHSTQKINDMSYNQLISDPSTYVKKRAQRSDDSILLRHMDDVVGTVPDEHLMSDFEHTKTSLYLTDVVVLRHEGDTVNFLGLEITKTSRGFEVKNSTDLVEPLSNLYGLDNSKPTANPGRRSTVMELASATPLDGHDYSNFHTAVGKLIFMAPWRPDMQFAFQQLSTQVFSSTTDSKRAVKQLIRFLKGKQHTCLRLEPRGMVQQGLLELVGGSDSDVAGDSAPRQSVTGYHCDVQNVTVRHRSLKQTAISLSSCEADRVLRSQCLRKRTVGTRRTLQRTSLQRFSSSRDRFRLGKTHSTAQGTRRTRTYRNTMPCNTPVDPRETFVGESSGHEEQHCRSLHETSGWIAKTVAREETRTSNSGLYELY